MARTPVLVGIDGSAHAWRVLEWAAEEARLHRLPLRILHASPALLPGGYRSKAEYERLDSDLTDMLAAARAHVLRRTPWADVTSVLVAEGPGRALVTAAGQAAMVVVGSRAIGVAGRRGGRSVGLHVAAHAPCPVFTVPVVAPGPGMAPDEIVVGVAERHPFDQVLAWAFAEADARRARLTAVHVVVDGIGAPRQRIGEYMELSEALAGWLPRYPDLRVRRVVAEGPAAKALVTASGEAGLLVLGARRRPVRFGTPLGRVDHAVLQRTRCPVVIVPEEIACQNGAVA